MPALLPAPLSSIILVGVGGDGDALERLAPSAQHLEFIASRTALRRLF